jgi:hypothetical protein
MNGWAARPDMQWQVRRVWVHPPVCGLAQRIIGSSASAAIDGGVLFEVNLSAPRFAHIWDHIVAGASLVPGVLFMELAAVCLHAVVQGDNNNNEYSNDIIHSSALANVAVPMPALLPPSVPAAQAGAEITAAVLRCAVRLHSVQVASAGMQQRFKPCIHLQASACMVRRKSNLLANVGTKVMGLTQLVPSLAHAAAAAVTRAAVPRSATASIAATLGMPDISSVCHDSSQLDALLQLSAVLRGVLYHTLAHQLQVPASVDMYMSHMGHYTATGDADVSSSSSYLANATVRDGTTAQLMVADLCMQQAAERHAGCSITGLHARQANASVLLMRGHASMAQRKSAAVIMSEAVSDEQVRKHSMCVTHHLACFIFPLLAHYFSWSLTQEQRTYKLLYTVQEAASSPAHMHITEPQLQLQLTMRHATTGTRGVQSAANGLAITRQTAMLRNNTGVLMHTRMAPGDIDVLGPADAFSHHHPASGVVGMLKTLAAEAGTAVDVLVDSERPPGLTFDIGVSQHEKTGFCQQSCRCGM